MCTLNMWEKTHSVHFFRKTDIQLVTSS
uniref:Uncharacterized protein n=1 Tax=Anguilla anguilla TaxID=7936 RepID=A0A0E9VBZ7_ANGAN